MGQAKLRGRKEERIAQSKAKRQPPQTGLYVSTKKPLGMRFVVEDVTSDDDEDFFLIQIIDEASADDPSVLGDELDPDEWFTLVDQYGLIKSES